MRKLLAIPLTALVAIACADTTTTAPELEVPGILAAVKLVDDNNMIPVSFTILNPCTFEPVAFQGTDHQIFKLWDNGSFKLHLQYNLHGVGLISGLHYKFTDAINEQGGPGGLPYVLNNVGKIISPTNAGNFLVKTHITINENGVVTVNRSAFKCVG